MDCLVVYETRYGNTGVVARTIARQLENLLPPTDRVRVARVEDLDASVFDDLGLIAVAAPTLRHGAPSDLRGRLDELPPDKLAGVDALVVDTRYHGPELLTGSAAHVIAGQLEAHGARLLASPESFFVVGREGPLEAGEIERAAAWAQEALARRMVQQPA